MKPEELAAAPGPRASAEVVNGYARVALLGLVMARCLRAWGWNASCTMDGRADLVLPLAARHAGLGSIGRSGLLLSDAYGPCLRLGAVVTDLPLAATPAQACGVARRCAACGRCAKACPAGAIDKGPPAEGRYRPIDDDACFAKWKEFGTDCGLCIAACPYSKGTQG
jgi:epoxyqueuosine reductase QueG